MSFSRQVAHQSLHKRGLAIVLPANNSDDAHSDFIQPTGTQIKRRGRLADAKLGYDSKMTDQELDARGLSCPLPVLKARKVLKSMPVNAELSILATDPKAPGDFQQFCEAAGHVLVKSEENGNLYQIVVRKGG